MFLVSELRGQFAIARVCNNNRTWISPLQRNGVMVVFKDSMNCEWNQNVTDSHRRDVTVSLRARGVLRDDGAQGRVTFGHL